MTNKINSKTIHLRCRIKQMNTLFDHTEKLVKFNRSLSQQLQIKHVLNPYTQTFIDAQLAQTLGILSNGYYRNRYGGLIPINIAASKGLVEFTINDQMDCEEMEIEYRSKYSSMITNLLIRQVYDRVNQCMITFRQAIDKGYLDTEFYVYSCLNISMSIHEAFYRGLILGELRTNISEQTLPHRIVDINENKDFEYENLFSSLTNIVNSLSEFTKTINVVDECQLTTDGYIQHRKTGKCYLLTQAMELGLISFHDISQILPLNQSNQDSTLVNDTTNPEQDFLPQQNLSFFSNTFIFDLLKETCDSVDENPRSKSLLPNLHQFLPVINTC